MSLTELLLKTQDHTCRAQAEAAIKQVEVASADEYFKALAQELADPQKPLLARQLSGLLLKNGLAAKDATLAMEKKNRWLNLSDAVRDMVKQATTHALIAPELDVGKAAAQVLAKIGAVEIPVGKWPGLVPLLLEHVTNSDPRARQIALITLGYLCEDLVVIQEDGTMIDDQICNGILTAVVQGMKEGELTTKLAATKAFYHAVVLARRSFRSELERNVIMEIVFQTCELQGSEEVQIAAFECLVQIATEYYEFLMNYMQKAGMLTLQIIQSAPEKVAIPAMEFWSTVCDEELYVLDAQAAGDNTRPSLNLIEQALPLLVPLLVQTLTRQQSEEDDDTWNLAMAAGTCLGLVSQVVGDKCVDLVVQFISANFGNADWRFREAAVLAYGSIMEGPSSEKLQPIVMQSLEGLVNTLNDSSVAVRDTVAWTLGRIAQFHPAIVPVKNLMPIICQKLQDVPRVAANICWVIQVIAEAQPGLFLPGHAPQTTVLSEFFIGLVQGLLQTVERKDADERQLRMAGYNALSVVVAHTGEDCCDSMAQLTQQMLTHLMGSFGNLERECELQGLICGVLTSLVTRLREKIRPLSESVMEGSVKVIQAYQHVRGNPQVLQEEALLLSGAVANSVGVDFERFMPLFAPMLKVGLENYEEIQVCLVALGILSDVCRALDRKIITYSDTFVQILVGHLEKPAVDRKIKAAALTCFGDIALAVQGDFEKYLPKVLQLLLQAAQTKITDGPANNEDWVEYLNSLREGVLEAYTGIIHGLRESGKLPLLKDQVLAILMFVKAISEDATVNEAVMKACVGVIGDLVFAFQQELTVYLASDPTMAQLLQKLVQVGAMSQDPTLQRNSQWLQQLVQKFT